MLVVAGPRVLRLDRLSALATAPAAHQLRLPGPGPASSSLSLLRALFPLFSASPLLSPPSPLTSLPSPPTHHMPPCCPPSQPSTGEKKRLKHEKRQAKRAARAAARGFDLTLINSQLEEFVLRQGDTEVRLHVKIMAAAWRPQGCGLLSHFLCLSLCPAFICCWESSVDSAGLPPLCIRHSRARP